ncbi:MAG TPA: Wzz/FepE/Etk N-terminal domain-containing protein [Candidatus Binataceae bacterium]
MDSPKVNGQAIELAPNAVYDNGRASPVHLTESQHTALQILHYVGLLRARWILIVSVTIGLGLAAGLYTKYFTQKWYRAQAVITPINPASAMGGMSMSGPFDGVTSGLASLMSMGGSSDAATMAERDKAIMTSYAFTSALMKRYHLTQNIAGGPQVGPPVSHWTLHRMITGRLTSEFDFRSGNMTVYFVDPDPAQAQRILGYYLDSLRDQLRNEEVQSAASVATSLQDEIRKTSDALLQTQLYELMARQIQRETIAQVQSDFAFQVVEPPVVPDYAAYPIARDSATLVSAVTFVVLCAFFVISDFVRRAREQLEAASRAPEPPRASEPAWTVGERRDLPEDPRVPLRRSQL